LGGFDPFGGDEAVAVQTGKDGVQGAFFEGDRATFFEGTEERVAIMAFFAEEAENGEFQDALAELDGAAFAFGLEFVGGGHHYLV
jgi:hypothetical protein